MISKDFDEIEITIDRNERMYWFWILMAVSICYIQVLMAVSIWYFDGSKISGLVKEDI